MSIERDRAEVNCCKFCNSSKCMNTYERDRAEGMLQRIDDAARRSEDYRRRAVSAGVKPQKAAARAKAMYGRAYDRMVRNYNSRSHTPFGDNEEPF